MLVLDTPEWIVKKEQDGSFTANNKNNSIRVKAESWDVLVETIRDLPLSEAA